LDIKWNKGENNETVIGSNLFYHINFPRAVIFIICRENDVVSAQHDGDDDGKTDDVQSYVLLVLSNLLAFNRTCRRHHAGLAHPDK
jgi:hypothetical protein